MVKVENSNVAIDLEAIAARNRIANSYLGLKLFILHFKLMRASPVQSRAGLIA
jgi:hypothetical protein